MLLEIREQIEAFVKAESSPKIPLNQVKFILMTQFNKKSLMYSFISGKYLASYCELIRRLGYGKFNTTNQMLELDTDNEFIDILMNKYGCYKPV